MESRTQQAIRLWRLGEVVKALKIFKSFRVGLSDEERRILGIAYECYTGGWNFYESIGIDCKEFVDKAKDIIRNKFIKMADKDKLNFQTECGNSFTMYKDGVVHSHQSDENDNATDVPQHIFQIRDFIRDSVTMVKIPKDMAKVIFFSRDLKNVMNLDLDMELYIYDPMDDSERLVEDAEKFWDAYVNPDIEFAIEIDKNQLIY